MPENCSVKLCPDSHIKTIEAVNQLSVKPSPGLTKTDKTNKLSLLNWVKTLEISSQILVTAKFTDGFSFCLQAVQLRPL